MEWEEVLLGKWSKLEATRPDHEIYDCGIDKAEQLASSLFCQALSRRSNFKNSEIRPPQRLAEVGLIDRTAAEVGGGGRRTMSWPSTRRADSPRTDHLARTRLLGSPCRSAPAGRAVRRSAAQCAETRRGGFDSSGWTDVSPPRPPSKQAVRSSLSSPLSCLHHLAFLSFFLPRRLSFLSSTFSFLPSLRRTCKARPPTALSSAPPSS